MRGSVAALRRYPVKSMLGEVLAAAAVGEAGIERDRTLAVVDVATGKIASAKHPRLWRGLLSFSAAATDGHVWVTLPGGRCLDAGDPSVDALISAELGRTVHLSSVRPAGAALDRPSPEDVLEQGVDDEVPFESVEIGQGTTAANFVDFAPVHLITTATADHVGAEVVRFRPNIVVAAAGLAAFDENGWAGREIRLGPVRLEGIIPTPRCSVPTLEHGALPRAPEALRRLLAENRIEVPGFGTHPCAGVYARVLSGGTVRIGEEVVVA
ncbi:MAG: MOSC domain-containing protein [Acidimicrobiales bacterium]